MQLKYNNYVAFSHNHGITVNNSGYMLFLQYPFRLSVSISLSGLQFNYLYGFGHSRLLAHFYFLTIDV